MPYSIEWERAGVTWVYWGVVTGDELLRSNQEIYGSARFDDMTFQVVDLTRVERFDVTPDDMTVVAASDRAAALTNPNVRVAVAASDETVRRLSGLYAEVSKGSPWEQMVFDTVGEAQAWARRQA